jgi:hypothetical protein
MPFNRGQLVVLITAGPRERLWGRLVGLEDAGVAIRCMDMATWDESLKLIRQAQSEHVSVSTRFVPMHRVESLYLDEASSGAPSLEQLFRTATGQEAMEFLADPVAKRGKR